MSDIDELSSRIVAAMDRVAGGIETLGQASARETEALRMALEEERQVSAQLAERVRVLGDREAQRAATNARLDALDLEVQRCREAQEILAAACEALRAANAEGLGEADLINAALAAEVESLGALRDVERLEAEEIMAGLEPILKASLQAQQAEEA